MQDEAFEVVLETMDPTEGVIVKGPLEMAAIPYVTRCEDQYETLGNVTDVVIIRGVVKRL